MGAAPAPETRTLPESRPLFLTGIPFATRAWTVAGAGRVAPPVRSWSTLSPWV